MRYGFMSSSAPEATLDQLIEMAEQWGYLGIEPRIEWGHGHGVEPIASAAERGAIRDRFAQTPVELCCIATGCRFANPETVKAQVETAAACIELAGDVGCPRLRVFGGEPGEGTEPAKAAETLADALRQLAGHAADRGVTLLLETHDAWTNPDAVVDVIRRVDHPAVAVLWDVLHPLRTSGWSIEAAFETLRPHLQHVHIHDATLQTDALAFRPIGEGEVDHRRVVELLHNAGFDGFLSGEWINWEPAESHLPRELGILKRIEADLGIAD